MMTIAALLLAAAQATLPSPGALDESEGAAAALFSEERSEPGRGGLSPEHVKSLLGPPLGRALAGAELERRTHELSAIIRCPVCQGSSVADSPSTMAQSMKAEVRELLSQGYDDEQVLRYFELSYGELIRLKPKAEGLRALLWILPAVLLAVAAGAAGLALKRRSAAVEPEPEPARDALPEDLRLAHDVRRVREIAYGWPGGVPPAKGDV